MTPDVLLSSASMEWATPQDLFDTLNGIFQFTLDPCATPENAKCAQYFTQETDGLSQSWAGHRVFMNPPYGKDLPKWIEKGYRESLDGAMVVCLIPSRTDTRWWNRWVKQGEVHFIKGRLRFGGSKNSATFPSAIVIFYPQDFRRLIGD